MRPSIFRLMLYLGGVALLHAQQPAAPATALSREKIIASATDLMRQARYCALITVGDGGQPQARTVDPLPMIDGSLEVWVLTGRDSRKVAQLRRNALATLYYYLAATPGYVTLLGEAEILDTAATKDAAWKPGWGEERRKMVANEKFVLLHFRPHRLEMVSYAHGLANDPKTMLPVMLELR